MRIGYARVSTVDQDTAIQVEALKAAGCEKVFAERVSATSTKGRVKLEAALEFAREGDAIVVTKIDRLARSVADLESIVGGLKAKGVDLICIDQPVDTTSAAGKAFLSMLGVFAEFETSLRKERQLEGIAKAKAKGVYKGRAPISDAKKQEVLALRKQGLSVPEIKERTGLGRTSIFNIIKALA